MSESRSSFKNKSVIISRYVTAQSEYDKYLEYINVDQSIADEHLNTAGEKVYQAYELGMKCYLYKRYPELPVIGMMSYSEANKRRNALEKKRFMIAGRSISVDTKYLREQMELYASPAITDTSIDFNLLYRNSPNVNNGIKHIGEVPDKAKFIESSNMIRKFILTYIDETANLQGKQTSEFVQLQEKCNYWKKTPKYDLCLITGRLNINELDYENIASIPWSLVFDFDVDTDSNGLMKGYKTVFSSQPNVFNIEHPKRTVFDPARNKPYWYYANGTTEITTTIPTNLREWKRKYGTDLPSCMKSYHEVFAKPLKVIILGGEPKKVNIILGALDAVYDDLTIYLATNDIQFEDIQDGEEYESSFHIFKMNAEDFSSGLNQYAAAIGIKTNSSGKSVIGRNGEVIVRPEDYSHFNILYNGIADEATENDDDRLAISFYQGKRPLSWYGAKNGFAVQRSQQYTLYFRNLLGAVADKPYYTTVLWHAPGAGGTTLARQLAYGLTMHAPVVWLKHYTEGITRFQFEGLNNIVKMSIIIIAESSTIDNDDIVKLHGELRSNAIPHAILYVKRISKKSERNADSLLSLTDIEFDNMEQKLAPYCDESQKEVIHGLKKTIDERYPFFMSLYAFEEDFHGLDAYIESFVNNANREDLNILTYISIADKYANKNLPQSFFQTIDEEDSIGIFLDDENDVLVTGTEDGLIKIRHPSFATKIIDYTVYDHNSSITNIEKTHRMANKLIEFIKFSKSNQFVDYDETVEILKNLLITRDSNSMVKEDFAPVIEELRRMTSSEKESDKYTEIGRVLKSLVDVYPEEPHFLAHLSRFYTKLERNYVKGIETASSAVQFAVQNGDHDPLLYHICGMSHFRYVERKLLHDALENPIGFETSNLKESIQEELHAASEMFRYVRSTKKKDAGYISEIQMCICVVDFGKRIKKCSTEDFVKKYHDTWYMEYYEKAISLMEGFRSLYNEDTDNYYITSLETSYIDSIAEMADGAEKTISMWQKYLESADTKGKTIARRFIARTKIEHESDNKDALLYTKKLMEENMEIEPDNGVNLRLWFNAIRKLPADNPEILLDEAISKINIWKKRSDSVVAYFYYYVLLCLKSLNYVSSAEAGIEDAKNALCERSHNMSNRNNVFEWLGYGRGVERLIPASVYDDYSPRSLTSEEILNKGAYIEGKITSYHSERKALISASGIEVFFTPSGPKGAKQTITKMDVGKSVRFIMGFSYDGARAYNRSVEFISEEQEVDQIESLKGKTCKCTILYIDSYGKYLQVRLSDRRNVQGRIYKDKLADGKSLYDYNRGDTVYPRVIEINEKNGKKYLVLSFRPEEEDLDKWQIELRKIINNQ